MQIQRITLRKWCQLEGDFHFGAGLNSVRGPNGSGKTNLINAAIFALTGDISRLHGVKADNISVLANKKDKADVTLHFSHGQIEGKITRVLQPNPNQELILTCGEQQKKVTRDSEIAFELEKFLGVNQKMLLDYVFVPQWGIFKFIDQQPAVRARALAELFGADRAERIYKELGECKIEIPSASVNADIVRARIQQNKNELTLVIAQLSHFADLSEKVDDSVKEHRTVVAQWERKKMLLNNLDNINGNRFARTERIDALLLEIEPLAEQVKQLEESVNESEVSVGRAKVGLESWRRYDAFTRQQSTLTNELQELSADLNDLLEYGLVVSLDYVDGACRKELEVQLTTIRSEVQRFQQILNTFQRDGKVECPTCGTPVDQFHDRLTNCDNYIRESKPLMVDIERKLRISDKYDTDRRQYDDMELKLSTQVEAKQKQLSDLKQVDQPARSREDYQQLITSYSDALKDLRYRQETLQIGNGKVNSMVSELVALNDMTLKYQTEVGSISVTKCEAESASKLIEQVTERVVQRDTLRHRKRDLERLVEDDEEALDRCKVEQLRAEHLKQTVEHLNEVRGVYHELIKVIPQHNMELLRSEINGILDKFGTKFRVEAIDDLRFLLRYHSGRAQPAERLSGGERVLLALAFRIVVNSRYAKELGLLCLDEPTAGLDEDNLSCLEVAIGRLRELSQARGLQVIMVTHDPSLDGLFDHVIQLQAAS